MKKSIMVISSALLLGVWLCQKIAFEEYNLDNGMHVILHHDPCPSCHNISDVPCGVKDENPDKTGFAIF
jgi:hypothetical protein